MPISAITITTDTRALDTLRKGAERSPALMATASDRQSRRIRADIRKDLKQDAARPKPKLPFIWSVLIDVQRKVQRWYHAAIRRGEIPTSGGRYARQGKLLKAWRIIGSFKRTGGDITIENRTKGAEYVHGAKQVPSHKRNRRITIAAIERKYRPIIRRRYAETWRTVSDPYAGVK